jgi:hypothetical protein
MYYLEPTTLIETNDSLSISKVDPSLWYQGLLGSNSVTVLNFSYSASSSYLATTKLNSRLP